MQTYLRDSLKLDIRPQKTCLRPWHWGIDWLGCVLYPDRVMIRTSTKRRMEKNMRLIVCDYLDATTKDGGGIQSAFASYDGLLKVTDEGYRRQYFRQLYKCL